MISCKIKAYQSPDFSIILMMASLGKPIVSGVVDWKSYNAMTRSIMPGGRAGAAAVGVVARFEVFSPSGELMGLADSVLDCLPILLDEESLPFINFDVFGVDETIAVCCSKKSKNLKFFNHKKSSI